MHVLEQCMRISFRTCYRFIYGFQGSIKSNHTPTFSSYFSYQTQNQQFHSSHKVVSIPSWLYSMSVVFVEPAAVMEQTGTVLSHNVVLERHCEVGEVEVNGWGINMHLAFFMF